MTIQGSGTPITLGQIRAELGHSGSIGLRAAEIGTYGAINTNSTSRPDGTTPSLMSEWYGYDHAAGGGGPTLYPHSLGYHENNRSLACAASPTTYYSECSVLTTSCVLYPTNEITTSVVAGWYAAGTLSESEVYDYDGGSINAVTTCGAP